MIVFTFTTSRKLSVFTLHGQKNRLHPFSNQEEAEPRDSEVKRTTDAAKTPPLRHEARGSSSLFNGLCASDTPPGLRPCEKGRRGWRSHPESDLAEAGKGQQPADITTKKKRELTKWHFHTWRDLSVYIDHVERGVLSGIGLKSPFSVSDQVWKFGAGCCGVRRVLVQGKAAVAAVILLIFLIWANVGGEVKH